MFGDRQNGVAHTRSICTRLIVYPFYPFAPPIPAIFVQSRLSCRLPFATISALGTQVTVSM